MHNTYKLKNTAKHTLVIAVKYAVLLGFCFIILYPLFSKLVIAFMQQQDLYDNSVKYIPKNFTLYNLRSAVNYLNYIPTTLKTAALVFSLSVLQVFSTMLAGYGIARFRFPGKRIVFLCALLTTIVPSQITSVPMYIYFSNFNLIGTPVPLYLMSVTAVGLNNGLFIYLFCQFFKGFPKELEEAGQIDGAGAFGVFFRIIMPCATSITVTCFLFGFVWQWTDNSQLNTFWPNNGFLMNMAEKMPSTMWMQTSDDYWRSIMNNTGILLLIFPLLILYLFLQRYFVESIERSGIVG
ncbi:MAG TPA: carbohydrate ABC transporter permease [Ruminococcaceae bacterium]|nr:carbohydrate ABC transporter permease [Oscillospiraceae bacterium]